MTEYPLHNSLNVDDVATDFLNVLDWAQEREELPMRFSLVLHVTAHSTPYPKLGLQKTEKFQAKTREPVRSPTQAFLFLRRVLGNFAYQSPRGLEGLRIEAKDEETGACFAAVF